jgi:myo-inositol 2-dehydrogenase / D-chiro-inositol 1-dehydrogenase
MKTENLAQDERRSPTRREFLSTTAALGAGAAFTSTLSISRSAHAAGSDQLKVGLIGCGGRGSGAAADALQADKNIALTAMGDAFQDRLDFSLRELTKKFSGEPQKIQVSPDRCFVGFDAYQKVIDSGVDVVLLCTPPHFRPAHLRAAVAAGKHVFCEKPVAVDGPGVRSVLETCEAAKSKNLSIVSGLCYRYDEAKREVMDRIHNGAIGDILALNVNYLTGTLWFHPRKDSWSDMEWQVRNWLYYTWLSGDHNVEQHVHSLDKAAWAMKDEPPVSCTGIGGRQVRVEPKWGNIFDHFSVTYQYANGSKLFAACRQMSGCENDVNDYVIGTKGAANIMRHEITGENSWKHRRNRTAPKDMYQAEHDALFESIRKSQPINNGLYMSRSSLMAIMGRMSAYTGQPVTWDQALNSSERLGPEKYEWGPAPEVVVAVPGVTKLA